MSQLGIAGYSSHLHLHLGMPSTTKNTFFLGKYSQIWVGGVADSQTGPKKTNHPENHYFLPEIHLSCSQISQKPWGVLKDLGKSPPLQEKRFFCGP